MPELSALREGTDIMRVRRALVALAAALPLIGVSAGSASAASAAKSYEIIVCTEGIFGSANVVGYNEKNQLVKTPDFKLNWSGWCGYAPNYRFKEDQIVEINASDSFNVWTFHMDVRYCRNYSATQRVCVLPY
ncbi:hypothetical protein ACGFNX_24670 [Streptomyces sp. NPDC048723]|uniref:hypothetical protein n=1 Tax=unclassified Streptomyces TaxID=2593676 RepID=UPI0035625A58